MEQAQFFALKKKIDRAQVVSFDLYDTLVFRKVRRPQDIFLLMEYQTGIPDFCSIRQKMQIRAAGYYKKKNGWPHPSLHEIYCFWKKCGWPVHADQGFSHTAMDAGQTEALERRLEADLAAGNAVMQEMFDYAREKKKRVVVATDMYLERQEIEKILKCCSYAQWDSLYVSSELRRTKYDGSLFDVILDKEKTEPEKILHIGDDRYADQKKAAQKGMQTFLYQAGPDDLARSFSGESSRPAHPDIEESPNWSMPENEKNSRLPHTGKKESPNWSMPGEKNSRLPHLRKKESPNWSMPENEKNSRLPHTGKKEFQNWSMPGEKNGRLPYPGKKESPNWSMPENEKNSRLPQPYGNNSFYWYMLGYQVGGPLYMGLCTWLKEIVRGKKLYCLSRDGYNLTRLLPRFGMEKPEYIYSSRRAMLLAHITKLGKEELDLLPPYSCGQSIREVLEYLGLEQIPEREFQKAGFSGYDAVIHDKRDIARIKRIYQLEERLVLQVCRKERENLKRYFQALGISGREILCFDSGWSGTSQYLMKKVFEAMQQTCRIRFCYAGIRKNATVRRRLQGCPYRSYFSAYLDKKTLGRLLSAPAVLELFFSEDGPPLRSYEETSLQFDRYERRVYIAAINQGIEDYIVQNRKIFSQLSPRAVMQFGVSDLVRLVLQPDELQAAYIGDLENTDRLSVAAGMKKYIARIPGHAFIKQPFLDIYWEQGIYRHPENPFSVKCYVWCRQRAAFIAKMIKNRQEDEENK